MLHYDPLFALGLFCFGLLIGAIAPTFGIGGGILTVPLLISAYGFTGDIATATSLGVIIFTTLSSTLSSIREKRIDYQVALTFMIFAIPGSIAGSLLSLWLKNQELQIDILQILFAFTLLIIAALKILKICFPNKDKKVESPGKDAKQLAEKNQCRHWWPRTLLREIEDKRCVKYNYAAKLFPGVIIALAGGFIGAALGLGGGIIYVPVLTVLIGVPTNIATATSVFTIFISNFFAVFFRYSSIQWDYVILLSLGTVISANIIPRFIHKVKSSLITTGFWILTVAAALRMLLKVFGLTI